MLAYLAFRAGTGKVWNYTLEALGEGSGVSERHVRRGLDLFAAEGLIDIKRSGPNPSEYTVNFEIDPTSKSGHFRHGKPTTKL